MSEARTSSHQMPHGLHHMPPSAVATVMWPDRFSRQPSRARMRSAHASSCGTVSSRPMPGPGRGTRTGIDGIRETASARDGARDRRDRRARRARWRRARGARGVDVRAIVRRRRARRRRDAPVAERRASADLARSRRRSTRACAGVQRHVPRVSSPTRDQVELETNAIEAAEAAGVEHIVKVSNIPIAGLDTGLHGNHRAIERRLAASTVARRRCCSRRSSRSVIDKPARRRCGAAGSCCRPARAGSRGSTRATSPRSRPRRWRDPDPPTGALHLTGPGGARRRRGRGPRSASRDADRSAAPLDTWRDEPVGRAASTRGSRTRPCTSTRRSRAARSRDVDRHGRARARPRRRARSTSGFATSCYARLRQSSDGRARGSSLTRGSRAKCIVAGTGGQPGSPVRANAAHASRIARPTARGRRRRAPTNSSQPSTKLPNVNGMSMPWHAPSRRSLRPR